MSTVSTPVNNQGYLKETAIRKTIKGWFYKQCPPGTVLCPSINNVFSDNLKVKESPPVLLWSLTVCWKTNQVNDMLLCWDRTAPISIFYDWETTCEGMMLYGTKLPQDLQNHVVFENWAYGAHTYGAHIHPTLVMRLFDPWTGRPAYGLYAFPVFPVDISNTQVTQVLKQSLERLLLRSKQ